MFASACNRQASHSVTALLGSDATPRCGSPAPDQQLKNARVAHLSLQEWSAEKEGRHCSTHHRSVAKVWQGVVNSWLQGSHQPRQRSVAQPQLAWRGIGTGVGAGAGAGAGEGR